MSRKPDAGDESRRVTIREVAAKAGVSPATVSRVLGGTYPVAASTRARVLRAIRQLDYVVNAQARALAGAATKTVAYITPHVTAPFYAYIISGVEAQATAEGRLCLVYTTHADPARELAAIDLMREQRTDAVILVGGVTMTAQYEERMARCAHGLHAAGSRLVLCGRPPLQTDAPAAVVEYDNEGGAYAITSYLLSLGHRRIAYVGGPKDNTTVAARISGYRRAHAALDVEGDPALIISGSPFSAGSYTATKKLLATRRDVTAIFAHTDPMAAGALRALREAGVRCPDEISVVGYGDAPPTLDFNPALTSVHIPHEELGRTAVRLALHHDEDEAYAGHQHIVLGTHLVIRDSTQPPKGA